MKRTLLYAALGLASLVMATPPVSAKAFGLFTCGMCCCKSKCCVCVRPYNAFSPVMHGCLTLDGCFPFQGCCGAGCGPACGPCPTLPFGGMPACGDGCCAAAPVSPGAGTAVAQLPPASQVAQSAVAARPMLPYGYIQPVAYYPPYMMNPYAYYNPMMQAGYGMGYPAMMPALGQGPWYWGGR
jgi:hypothetical protein